MTDKGDPFDAARVAYEAGYAVAIETAVQRVTELPDLIDAGFAYYMNLLNGAAVIDAIRGES